MLQKIIYKIPQEGFNINIKALSNNFDRICIFDSNEKVNRNKNLHCAKIIAIGANEELIVNRSGNAIQELQDFIDKKKSWIFGYLSYELKNEIEVLSSENTDNVNFPLLHFFSPKVVIQVESKNILVHFDDEFLSGKEAENIYFLTISRNYPLIKDGNNSPTIQAKITRADYIDAVNELKQHIRLGDIYEVNFCQEFFGKNVSIDPAAIFEKLNAISQAPFAAFGKFSDHYLLCSSPERFIKKQGNRLISQPVKGTIRRSENLREDIELKNILRNDPKERSENVMIVDLVRNDLSKVAKKGSVQVDELFGIYEFKQVHQMISTVSCEIKENTSFSDIIKAAFPMGSMTGAPKVSAMKLIEEFESTKRGIYSGAIGYITPEGDLDFNVIIRSILYDEKNNYLSFMVGSAITDRSVAEYEYEECLLKAKAMFDVLNP